MTTSDKSKVFLMWSGSLSKSVAQALHKWIPFVIQTVQPFMSSEDIRKGQRWGLEIGSELQATQFGIACLTADNLTAPWIHFEAGAISKQITDSRVAALRINVEEAK